MIFPQHARHAELSADVGPRRVRAGAPSSLHCLMSVSAASGRHLGWSDSGCPQSSGEGHLRPF